MTNPDKEKELLVAVVWKTMKEIIKYCQQMTANKVGYFICMKTVRTKAVQIRYQLLQLYMDHASIVNHAWLWKQMVAFFIHTWGRENEKPKY